MIHQSFPPANSYFVYLTFCQSFPHPNPSYLNLPKSYLVKNFGYIIALGSGAHTHKHTHTQTYTHRRTHITNKSNFKNLGVHQFAACSPHVLGLKIFENKNLTFSTITGFEIPLFIAYHDVWAIHTISFI